MTPRRVKSHVPASRIRTRVALLLACGVAACTQFPEIDAVETPGVENAPYPELLPLDTLLESGPPRATPEMRGDVEARAAALKARAAGLDGPVVDDATRSRMARGVSGDG